MFLNYFEIFISVLIIEVIARRCPDGEKAILSLFKRVLLNKKESFSGCSKESDCSGFELSCVRLRHRRRSYCCKPLFHCEYSIFKAAITRKVILGEFIARTGIWLDEVLLILIISYVRRFRMSFSIRLPG